MELKKGMRVKNAFIEGYGVLSFIVLEVVGCMVHIETISDPIMHNNYPIDTSEKFSVEINRIENIELE